jgi:pyruvate ferredoxin oxidoreductase gamma subunit
MMHHQIPASNPLLEIRIHGRGGQGNVAAAELLAQAAFLAGKHVQAFPAFGAERMGAPVVAFVRLSDAPIHVRSQVYAPRDLIVQDHSLLTIDAASITAGLQPGGLVLVNASEIPDELIRVLSAGAQAVAVPATDIALEVIGRPVPNTTLLGAYAALTGVLPLDAVQQAVRARFRGDIGDRNAEAAERGYIAAERAQVAFAPENDAEPKLGRAPTSTTALTVGLIADAGSSAGPTGYHTGAWRVFRPVWDSAKCTGCNLCEVYCPESVVFHRGPRDYDTDLAYCKGCGLCAEECQPGAITMVREDSLVTASAELAMGRGG